MVDPGALALRLEWVTERKKTQTSDAGLGPRRTWQKDYCGKLGLTLWLASLNGSSYERVRANQVLPVNCYNVPSLPVTVGQSS